jgi:hypothetical protein
VENQQTLQQLEQLTQVVVVVVVLGDHKAMLALLAGLELSL